MEQKQETIEKIAKTTKEVKYAPFNDGTPTYTAGHQMADFVFDLIAKAIYEQIVEPLEKENKTYKMLLKDSEEQASGWERLFLGVGNNREEWKHKAEVLEKENKKLKLMIEKILNHTDKCVDNSMKRCKDYKKCHECKLKYYEQQAEARLKELQGKTTHHTNTCVCCGEVIPEGNQVCPNCMENNNEIQNG